MIAREQLLRMLAEWLVDHPDDVADSIRVGRTEIVVRIDARFEFAITDDVLVRHEDAPENGHRNFPVPPTADPNWQIIDDSHRRKAKWARVRGKP